MAEQSHQRSLYPRECVLHDKNEIGSIEIKVVASDRLKIKMLDRREIRVSQAEQFRCPDGDCIYVYTVARLVLSEEGRKFCELIPLASKDGSASQICAIHNAQLYGQIVRVIADGPPVSWKTVSQRVSYDGPFLDEWAALRALKLQP